MLDGDKQINNNDWTAISGKIVSKKHNYNGIFVIIMNTKALVIDNATAAFSIYSDILDISFDSGWNKFEHKIEDLKYGGSYAEAISNDVTSGLLMDFQGESIRNDISEFIRKNMVSAIQELLEKMLQKIMLDTQARIEIHVASFDEDALEAGRIRSSDQKTSAELDQPAPSKLTVLPVKLVLAPVGGKLVTDLKTGDIILISIPSTGTRNAYYQDMWKLKKPEGGIKNVAGTIVEKKDSSSGTKVKLHLKDDVFGEVLEEEKVLVKLFNPAKDADKLLNDDNGASLKKQETNTVIPKEKIKTESPFSLYILMGAGVVVLLAMTIGYLILTN